MFVMSVTNNALKHAHKVGYRVTREGKVLYKNKPRKLDYNRYGYARVRVRDERGKVVNIPIHRLLAYQKFGECIFDDGVCVRHLDGDPSNNVWDNIETGTQSDNMLDRDPDERMAHAIKASSHIMQPVLAGGIEFPSYLSAARHFGISDNGIRKRIKLKWDGYRKL